MGRTVRSAIAVVAVAALGACTADDDDDGAAVDEGGEAAATVAASDQAAGTIAAPAVTVPGDDAEDLAAGGGAAAQAERPGRGSVGALVQQAGPAIAIEARATVRVDDVRATVDELTAAVIRRGGRVASADVDFAPGNGERSTDKTHATLVLAVPPAELARVVDLLEDVGTVVSFDQLAEDVSEQLVDLDTRITNVRASVVRVRALLESATDIEGIIRLEGELTSREIELERLLAAQRQIDERVAMSTLTVAVVARPPEVFAAVSHTFEADRPGVAAAMADGWNAFVTGAYGVALAVATILPFLAVAGLVLLVGLRIRRATSPVSSRTT